jgi:small subunit ribosomal protein S11
LKPWDFETEVSMAKPAAAGGAAATDKKGKKKTFKKKERKHVPHGLCYVQASFNNTIVTITDMNGNVLSWKSSGSLGFRGSRKGTPFAAQQAASNAASMARDHGVRSVDVRVSGPGSGRESAVRALASSGIMDAVRRREGAYKGFNVAKFQGFKVHLETLKR